MKVTKDKKGELESRYCFSIMGLRKASEHLRFLGHCKEHIIFPWLEQLPPCHCFDNTEDLIVYP